MRAEILGAADIDRLLDAETDVIEAARPYLRLLSEAAGGERHAAMLGDAKGFVLDVVGDELSVSGPESVPGPGSLLAEAMSGANGIGTPLAEGGYVEIIGAEHFIVGFHPFTCQGTPISGPDQEVAAVISTSVRSLAASERLRHILFCAAHGIEADLLAARLQADISAFLNAPLEDTQAVRRLHQDVVQAHHAGRLGLQAAAQLLPQHEDQATVRGVLQRATACLQQFMSRARTWRQLAGGEQGISMEVDAADVVRRMLDLLQTEATVRRVTVVSEGLEQRLQVVTDERRFARAVLRGVVAGFEATTPGGTVVVELRRVSPEVAALEVRATPADCGAAGEPRQWRIDLTRSRR
jgi:transcriptional regulator of acetoin/glycerol metabolism